MKAMEISRYGQHDARSRLVRFSTELLKLNFQTRPKIWREQSCFYNELSALSPGWGRSADRTCLQGNSLQTGIFAGKSRHFGFQKGPHAEESPCAARLLLEFPASGLQGKDSNEQGFLVR
jgi:hypothetical protein